MSGINKVLLIGNLGRDPEMRYTQDGSPVCNFSIATSETWKDRNTGEKREKTEWHRIVTFRRLAEICARYLRKGSKVFIEGKLQTRSYEKDGATHYITEIVANELNMLDSAQRTDGGGQQNQGYNPRPENQGYSDPGMGNSGFQSQQPQQQPQFGGGGGFGDYPEPPAIEDDEIPF